MMARMTGLTGRYTEAGSADGMREPDQPPISGSPSARGRRKPRRTGDGVRVVVTCLVLFLMIGAGVFAFGDAAAPLRMSQDDRSGWHKVTTIKLPGEEPCSAA